MTLEALRDAGYALDQPSYDRLQRYVELLLDANTRVNLTGAKTPEALWPAHICDSLTLIPILDEAEAKSVLDLGSGGGLPGIPLACVRPEMRVVLLDSTRKKLSVLETLLDAIGLPNVQLCWSRAEEAAHDASLRETFDGVTARGVGELARLVEYASGFVRPGGRLWLYKSLTAAGPEIEAARRAAGQCGLQPPSVVQYELPEGQGSRVMVVYHKAAPLRRDLPRRSDQIARAPL